MAFDFEGSKLKEYLEAGGEEVAVKLEEAFSSASSTLKKSIKKSLTDGSSKFRKDFLESASGALTLISQNQMDVITAGGGDAAKQFNEAIDGFVSDNVDATELADIGRHLLDKLPAHLRKILGPSIAAAINNAELETASKNFESAAKDGFNNALSGIPSNAFTKAIGLDAGIEIAGKQFADTFKARGAKVGRFIAKNWRFALGVGLVAGLFMAIDKQTNAIGDNFGAVSSDIRNELTDTQAEFARLGMSAEDMATTVKGLSSDFGVSFTEAKGLAGGVADTAKALNMTADEGSKLIGLLMTTSGLSAEQAQNFAKGTEMMARMAGVAPGVVMKDIANASEDVALFTKDGGQNIAQAAVQARKFGVNLSTVAKTAKGLLNFSDSLNAELEASVMLGKNINLQKARELALSGDLAGVAAEISRQVGGQAEFEKMNVLERESLAAAVGMSVEELSKFVSLQGKSNEELKRTTDYDISEVVGANAIGNVTQLKNELEVAKLQLISFTAGIANFGGIFGDLPPMLQLFNLGLIALGTYMVFTIGRTLAQSIANRVLAKSFDKLADSQNKVGDGAKPKKGMGFIKSLGKNMGAILKGAAALLIISGAMLVAGFAFKLFSDDVDWTSVLYGTMILIGLGIAAALLGTFAPLILVGAGALMMVAGALLIAAVASIAFGIGSQLMLPFLQFVASDGAKLLLPLLGLALGLYALTGALTFLGLTSLLWIPALFALSIGMGLLGVGLGISSIGMEMFVLSITPLLDRIGDVGLFALALTGLAGSMFLLATAMTAVGVAGAFGLPALLALGVIGGTFLAVSGASGGEGNEEGSSTKDLYDQLVLMNERLVTIEENFQKNWVPAIVESNVEGAKQGAKDTNRSMSQKLGF